MPVLRTLTLASVVLATTLAAEQSIARDRPGTPNEVQVWQRESSLSERPRLQVSFRNTAKEKVHFWFEWTANGEPQSKADLRPMLSCPDPNTYGLICSLNYLAFPQQDGRERATSVADDRGVPYEIIVKDVAFDTEYCFRFMAQDEDGVISEIWSAWACRRTRPAPAPPGKPAITQVSVLPAKSGQGESGGPVPARVLVEWTGDRDSTAGYSIERQFQSGWMTQGGGFRRDLEPLEAAVPVPAAELPTLERPARYRVCASNISGKTCSDGVSTATYAASPRVDSDAIVAPPSGPILETAPQGDAAGAAPPAAPPAAEQRRRGPFVAP
jgi:hypothetical protein